MDRIGDYEVLEELGRGGAGAVYRARTRSGRQVAIKVLHRTDGDTRARFEREKRLLGEVTAREGFVPLLDAGFDRGCPHLVMPLVAGGTLRDRLQRGPLDPRATLALGRKLAAALGRAHERGVVHRDLKPENVLFTGEGEPLIADLGLAKHFDRGTPGASQSVSLSSAGTFAGTAAYMPPEQIADMKSVGPAADVYALGAVLYECLAGTPAYSGATVLEVLANVAAGRRTPLARARSDAPSWLVAAVERSLALDPARRFPDGAAFRAALDADPEALTSPRTSAKLLLAGVVAASLGGLILALGGRAAGPPRPPVALPATPAPVPSAAEVPRLPAGLRAGATVAAAGDRRVSTYVWRLPRGPGEVVLVAVPAGDFIMGSEDPDAMENEAPRHLHRIERPYFIARNDVTWAEFRVFAEATGGRVPDKPAWWREIGAEESEHPVVNVTWTEAKAYARWAGLDLPTEAEWEKAARGEDGRRYPWGEEWDPGARCNYADRTCPLDTFYVGDVKGSEWIVGHGGWDREHSDGFPFTSPVGSFPFGVSPVGALDMAGNVWQWCDDWMDDKAYERYAKGDFAPPGSGTRRIARGPGWSGTARRCRSARRDGYAPDTRSHGIGLRLVLRADG